MGAKNRPVGWNGLNMPVNTFYKFITMVAGISNGFSHRFPYKNSYGLPWLACVSADHVYIIYIHYTEHSNVSVALNQFWPPFLSAKQDGTILSELMSFFFSWFNVCNNIR